MPTILLVEDAPDLADVLIRELRACGWDVAYAADGPAALREAQKCSPDLVILDWMLPGLDGLEVLRRLRSRSAVPVLMLTARSEEADRVIGLEVGADDYLTKPFSMRELLARVRAQLRRAEQVRQLLEADRSGAGQAITWQDIRLDPVSRQATQHGQALDLSRTEFDLLHLLMRNPGRAFSRTYLLESVWGENYIEGDRSVDNAVLRLRKKLGEPGDGFGNAAGSALETVWGVGYRLKPEKS